MSNITEEPIPLLPCPFCGATAHVHTPPYGNFAVLCDVCGAESALGDTKDSAIAAWNSRASAPVLSEEQRGALLRAAQMFVDDATEFGEHKYYEKGMAQAALLRAMAERGASDSASPQTPATSPDGLR